MVKGPQPVANKLDVRVKAYLVPSENALNKLTLGVNSPASQSFLAVLKETRQVVFEVCGHSGPTHMPSSSDVAHAPDSRNHAKQLWLALLVHTQPQ